MKNTPTTIAKMTADQMTTRAHWIVGLGRARRVVRDIATISPPPAGICAYDNWGGSRTLTAIATGTIRHQGEEVAVVLCRDVYTDDDRGIYKEGVKWFLDQTRKHLINGARVVRVE
jgi:hypothetical protein